MLDSGRYVTAVNELCDHIPALPPELLRPVVDEAGHEVVGVFVLLDRRQGAAEALARSGVILTPLFRLADLVPSRT
ncbi:hypothetical protein [Streptomyces sp. NPDC013187]|uniref:hypothetical protein n=1 Tax=Streptomyces sp. NPDC013187 TaxID=3364865 RepID=UPI0036B3B133